MLPHLSYNPSPPTPLHSLPYKSHDPSFNYLTTQDGSRENLKTQQKKKRGSLRPFPSFTPSPYSPHLLSSSKPIFSLSWEWLLLFDTNISFGEEK